MLCQILRESEAASIAESVQARGGVADSAHRNLLRRDCDHFFRDDVGRHHIE